MVRGGGITLNKHTHFTGFLGRAAICSFSRAHTYIFQFKMHFCFCTNNTCNYFFKWFLCNLHIASVLSSLALLCVGAVFEGASLVFPVRNVWPLASDLDMSRFSLVVFSQSSKPLMQLICISGPISPLFLSFFFSPQCPVSSLSPTSSLQRIECQINTNIKINPCNPKPLYHSRTVKSWLDANLSCRQQNMCLSLTAQGRKSSRQQDC